MPHTVNTARERARESEPGLSERTRAIWEHAEAVVEEGNDWPEFLRLVVQGYYDAIEQEPEDLDLRCEAAGSLEFLRMMLRGISLLLLNDGLQKHPQHAEARSLVDALRSEVTLPTRCAYWEAGQAVAEVLLGRRLVRMRVDYELPPMPDAVETRAERERPPMVTVLEGDRVALKKRFLAQIARDAPEGLVAEIAGWMGRIPDMKASGILSDDEAAEAIQDLWRPFAFLAEERAGELPAGPEDRLRRDLAALLAGGEAERRLTHASSNSCLEEAKTLVREVVDESLTPDARSRALGWAFSKAEAIVSDAWPAIQALANAILEEDDLHGRRAEEIVLAHLAPHRDEDRPKAKRRQRKTRPDQ